MNTATCVSGKNVLLVEDDPAVRESIRLLLDVDRHAVTEASNGREALQLFAASRYDLVITDYLMPDMLGDELAENLKNLAPAQPILMVTAHAEKLANHGKPADAVLAKPFSLEDLRRAIARPTDRRVPVGAANGEQAFGSSGELEAEMDPRDARELVDSGTLILWIQEVVGLLNGCAPSGSKTDRSVTEMLELLTFAYACNVLATDEIRAACEANAAFRFLCCGSPPFASEIAIFRPRHRRELERALARTLAKVAACGANQALDRTYARFLGIAQQRLDIARHLDTLS